MLKAEFPAVRILSARAAKTPVSASVVTSCCMDKYRPWLYFDPDGTVWPCSATWFVRHSSLHTPCGEIGRCVLQNDPRTILRNGRWTSANRKSTLKLDVLDDFRKGKFPDEGAWGAWERVPRFDALTL